MNIPPLFNILASAALLSTPLHAQLYTLHGDGVKKTERVVEKADYSDYELVWHDEFDKDGRPDPAKWNYEHGFVRNKEAQWYQPENAYCKDGMLIIEGRKEKHANPHYDPEGKNWQTARKEAEYTSASLTTRSKFSWLYGRFEIRARFTPREGMWPAFWTLGVKEKWPMCGEIDIMEYYQSTYLANLCWGSPKKHVGKWSTTYTPLKWLQEKHADWADSFHVFRMDWDEKEVRLYADDILLNRTPLDNTVNASYKEVANPFRQPHFIILNLALGATGGDLDKLPLPQKYEIDYVRIYQKKDSPHKGTIPYRAEKYPPSSGNRKKGRDCGMKKAPSGQTGRGSSKNRKRGNSVYAAQIGTVFRLYGNLFTGLDEKGHLHHQSGGHRGGFVNIVRAVALDAFRSFRHFHGDGGGEFYGNDRFIREKQDVDIAFHQIILDGFHDFRRHGDVFVCIRIHEVITHAVNVAELIFLTGEVDAFQGFIGSQAKVIHLFSGNAADAHLHIGSHAGGALVLHADYNANVIVVIDRVSLAKIDYGYFCHAARTIPCFPLPSRRKNRATP